MTKTNAAVRRRDGLIQAPIRTRLGNVVLRWVRPDNPNIVERPETAAVEAPEEVLPKWYEASMYNCSCCGASYYRATDNQEPAEWTPERIKDEWITTWNWENQFKTLIAAANRANDPVTKKYYTDAAQSYSLERFTAQKVYLTNRRAKVDSSQLSSYGVIMCSDPIPDYTVRTPGGLYMKRTYEPANKATDDVFVAAKTPTFNMEGWSNSDKSRAVQGGFAFKDDKTVYLLGGVYSGKYAGHAMLLGAASGGAPVGCRVVAIFNQDQRNGQGKLTAQAVADAGFTEVLRTGNANHPNSSTLYVYERVIQKGDYDAL